VLWDNVQRLAIDQDAIYRTRGLRTNPIVQGGMQWWDALSWSRRFARTASSASHRTDSRRRRSDTRSTRCSSLTEQASRQIDHSSLVKPPHLCGIFVRQSSRAESRSARLPRNKTQKMSPNSKKQGIVVVHKCPPASVKPCRGAQGVDAIFDRRFGVRVEIQAEEDTEENVSSITGRRLTKK